MNLSDRVDALAREIEQHKVECDAYRKRPIDAAKLSLTTVQMATLVVTLMGAVWWASRMDTGQTNMLLQIVQLGDRIGKIADRVDKMVDQQHERTSDATPKRR